MDQLSRDLKRADALSPTPLFSSLRTFVIDSCIRMMHWLKGSPDLELFSRALNNEPEARAQYMTTRLLSIYQLPECVNNNLRQLLQSSFDIKLVEQKITRHIRESDTIYARLFSLSGKMSAESLSWAGPEAVRCKLSGFVLPSVDEAHQILKQMDETPFQPLMRQAADARGPFFRVSRGKKLVDDDIVGPMARKAAHAGVDLLFRATIVSDAQAFIGAELPPAAFLQLVRASKEPWGVFDLKVWKNMVALATHIRDTTPEVSQQELGAIIASFSSGASPIEAYDDHKESLSRKLRARLDAVEVTRAEATQSVSPKGAQQPERISREQVTKLLQDAKHLTLSASDLREQSRALTALLHKSGLVDLKLLRDLLAHRHHPETIARELRIHLRPELPPLKASQRSAPLADLPELPRMPSSFINFYKDANGRNDVTTWLQRQSTEIQELINSKLDLIAQGGKGKGLTRGANETLKGICEWRVKAPNVTLRIYYLPARRETGEVTVLMNGHKTDQFEDLREAQRRAEVVRTQRAFDVERDTFGDNVAES